MGVPRLWNVIQPAMDASTNLLQLSTQAFESTPNLRGLRVGIDASLWTYAQEMKERSLGGASIVGPNLALRNLFFKCCLLQKSGVLPLFIFDGPDRLRKINRSGGYRISRVGLFFQELLELMGIEWRSAPGEGEAELAALSDRDIIDANLTDDVDTLVFAKSATLIRNWSATLSGNQGKGAGNTSNPPPSSQSSSFPSSSQYLQGSTLQLPFLSSKSQSQSQPSKSQSTTTKTNPTTTLAIYRSSAIFEIVGLDHHAMILLAVLLGGDYDPVGFFKLGEKTALGLVKAGFGTSLFEGTRRYGHSKSKLEQFLDIWRGEVADELASNSKDLLGSKEVALSFKFREAKDFPRIDIIHAYISPNVSKEELWEPLDWNKMVDLDGLARFVRKYFEWGDGEISWIFKKHLLLGLLLKGIRQELLAEDRLTSKRSSASTSRAHSFYTFSTTSASTFALTPSQLLNKITEIKTANSTSLVESYRLILSETEFLRTLAPIIATLPPILIPVLLSARQRNDSGDLIEGKAEIFRKDDLRDLRHWVPKVFMVGKSAKVIVREYEDVLWEKENDLREKEEIKNKKARERQDESNRKIGKGTTYSSSRKRSSLDSGPSMEILQFRKKTASTSKSKNSTSNNTRKKPASSSTSSSTSKFLKRKRSPSPVDSTDEDEDFIPRHASKSARKDRGQTTASASTSTSRYNDILEISSNESDDDVIIVSVSSTKGTLGGLKEPDSGIEKGKEKGKEKEKVVEEKRKGKGKSREVVSDLAEEDRWYDVPCLDLLSDSD